MKRAGLLISDYLKGEAAALSLRAIARAVATCLPVNASGVLAQPGELFFEKQLHRLDPEEADSPDSLSLAFAQIAAKKNETIWGRTVSTVVDCLSADVCREISQAVLLEKMLIARENGQ